ncbi:hypothetical protein [[Phormidium] sp. ETS-05]|nr:hypothetical protein [[Phormidium] sp. ETS-05]
MEKLYIGNSSNSNKKILKPMMLVGEVVGDGEPDARKLSRSRRNLA